MMTSPIAIRSTSPADWPRICALMAQTPMSAALPLVIERSADHDRAYPTFGGTSLGLVAEHAGDLIGYIHARIERRAVWDGRALRPAPVAYIGDVRVAASHRRTGIARALSDAGIAELRARGVTMAFALINEGNRGAMRVVQANPSVRMALAKTFTTASRLLWRRPSRRAEVLVPATPDTASLGGLVASWRERLFGPWIEVEDLVRYLRAHPEVTLFRRRDESAPLLALADPSPSRRLLFKRLPAPFRALRAAWNGARPLTGAPRFPGHGEAWSSVEVVLTDRARLTPDLEPDLLAEAHRRGAHGLTVIESGLESEAPLRLSAPCQRLRTHLVAIGIGEDVSTPPAELPAHVDLSFI